MSDQTVKNIEETFRCFDLNDDHEINKEEAVKHWQGNFGKLSAIEFFNSVDANHDNKISYDEFLAFWKVVKGSGHSEEEINEELDRLKKKESWIGFNDLPIQYKLHPVKHN